MISGDNIETAKYQARQAGIIKDGELNNDKVCLDGDQFRDAIGGVGDYE